MGVMLVIKVQFFRIEHLDRSSIDEHILGNQWPEISVMDYTSGTVLPE
jgi:hypothetical protein